MSRYSSAEKVRATSDAAINGLLSGVRWSGGSVTWGAPDSKSDYGTSYQSDQNFDGISAPRQGFSELTSRQLNTISGILDANGPGASAAHAGFTVEGFTNLSVRFTESADLRFANSSDAPTAYAYQPGTGIGGDVWLGHSGQRPADGNYDKFALIHEIGHALGLKHPHESGGLGFTPSAYDSVEFATVSYRTHIGASPTGYHLEKGGAPQTFMMLDIAALQHLYGADFTTNSDDTTYSWRPNSGQTRVNGETAISPELNRIFATIWDGGGKDTYDLSAYKTDLRLDLRPGEASKFSSRQLADLDGGPNDGHARGNIYNALQYNGKSGSLIENAIGGDGDDRITGNKANNHLQGGDGADTLIGGAGADYLDGGDGRDVFRFNSTSDSRSGASDRIDDFDTPGRSRGDLIDLRQIDADTTRHGVQEFDFGTSHGRGDLWLASEGSRTAIMGNTDRDSAAEFVLLINDDGVSHRSYSVHDFLL